MSDNLEDVGRFVPNFMRRKKPEAKPIEEKTCGCKTLTRLWMGQNWLEHERCDSHKASGPPAFKKKTKPLPATPKPKVRLRVKPKPLP